MERDNPVKNNFVKKYMEEFNTPKTHIDRTKHYKAKNVRPVHEIEIDDPYLVEEDIWK